MLPFSLLLLEMLLFVLLAFICGASALDLQPDSGFHCAHDTCGVCEHVEWKKIHLNDTACLNLTYIPSTLSISLTLTLGNKTIINKTVSAHDPNVCVGVPYLKKFASVCLDFSNLTFSNDHLSGCVEIKAEIFDITVAKAHLGCFNIRVLDNEQVVLPDDFDPKKRVKSLRSPR